MAYLIYYTLQSLLSMPTERSSRDKEKNLHFSVSFQIIYRKLAYEEW